MSILELLPVSSMLGSPFADYLNLTFPLSVEEDVRLAIEPIIEGLGPFEVDDQGLYRLFNSQLRPTGGTVKLLKRGKVLFCSWSGVALTQLRETLLFDDFLSAVMAFPYRVSMLHATQDYYVESAPSVIMEVKRRAQAGDYQLTRKRIPPQQVKAITTANEAGIETGTVYLGKAGNADVWAKVYDKQNERLSKGYSDPGSIVRVEVAIQSDVGATLRDVHDPLEIYFHFAGKSLVERPKTLQGWSSYGEGYVLPKKRDVLPYERLERFLDHSISVRKLVGLAVDAYGEKAGEALGRMIRKRCDVVAAAI